jgi:GNAT superfamily N-acetyltransferase
MYDLQIRPMTTADVDAACALARAQGWRDRRTFYDFVLRVPTCRPLVGIVDGRVAATALGTASGAVGWIGAVVVDEPLRRRGLGRAITESVCELLRSAGCSTLSLVATDAGRRLYEQMGFRPATHYHQLEAGHLTEPPTLPDGTRIRRLEPADMPGVIELDRVATGEDRSAPLLVLAENTGWIIEDDPATRTLRGFLLPADRSYGAIIAPRFEDGLLLLDWHRHIVAEGASVRAGIPHEHFHAWVELQSRGWQETWRAPRLILGPDIEWRPEWVWGEINSAMG